MGGRLWRVTNGACKYMGMFGSMVNAVEKCILELAMW